MNKIIHIDADCFFAALEIRKRPKLKAFPIAVGGAPNTRGVIATCNYVARQFGVRSAMSSAYAKRLCPQLEILTPDFELYRQASNEMQEIFSGYSDKIEPLSLDEAFLDVSNSTIFHNSATLIARDIRRKVENDLGICVSAGVAPVKFLAKIASDWNKPDGLFTVAPKDVEQFVRPLPLSLLPGVGKVTAEKLSRYGLYTCQDVNDTDPKILIKHFGRFAVRLIEMSRGIDRNRVQARESRKSISIERTYPEDVDNRERLFECLDDLIEGLQQRFSALKGAPQVSKKFIKLKFDNFEQTTIEAPASKLTGLFGLTDFRRLLHSGWSRQKRSVRLMGVGFRLATPEVSSTQLSLPLEVDTGDTPVFV